MTMRPSSAITTSAPKPIWSWLGRPLAIDFANTVTRAGREDVELLRAPWDLAEWARREHPRSPLLPHDFAGATQAEAAQRMREVRELRDVIRAVLQAAVDEFRPSEGLQALERASATIDGTA